MKICIKCKEEKELNQFYKSVSSKDNYENTCILCKQIYCKKRHNNNRSDINKYHKIYYENNKEQHLKRTNKWKINNKQKYQEYLNKYLTKYYHTNIQYKLRRLLRDRIYKTIYNKNITSKTKELLGCSFNELKIHLEQQFKPEMTWLNHGQIWEIDHIKPCSSFDLTDLEQQKQCFHYTNLQPLFKTENRQKSNKI
jgi:hypothetical protein